LGVVGVLLAAAMVVGGWIGKRAGKTVTMSMNPPF
jgi:uncharacterized membrane protein YfcA